MDLNLLNPDIQITNNYYFTLKNSEGKVIQQEVVHNEAQWKKYIRLGMTNLSLYLGIFTERDALKYQTNGYWNEGYAAQISGKTIKDSEGNEIFIPTGGYTVQSGTQYKVGEPNVIFRPNMKKNPSSLFGTQVFAGSMSWSCDKIFKNDEGYCVRYVGKTTWGYHSDTNPYNQYHESSGSASNSNGGFDFSEQSPNENKFGIKLFDGGLGSRNFGLFTHFATSMIKAPTDILEIKVEVIFMRIKLSIAGGSPIAPCMNAGFGHSLNSPNYSLTSFYPSTFGVSVYPSYRVQNIDEVPSDMSDFRDAITGHIPPIGSRNLFSLSSYDVYDQWLTTDTPTDWDEEKDGTWYGFPLYHNSYCEGWSPYVMRTEILKDGTEVKKYVYDSDGTRRISFSDLEPRTVLNYRSSCIGPIKCSLVNGFSVHGNSGFVPQNGDSHTVTFINIGYGDGVRTRFYHPFTEGIVGAYYTVGSSIHSAQTINYYRISDNIFARYPNFSCYRNGEKLFSHRPRSVDGSPSLPINNRIFNEELAQRKNFEHPYSAYQNYFPESKQTIFGLHPFDNNYYPTRGLLGKNEIVVHDFITAGKIIGSGWNGLDRDQWWSAPMYIITGDDEDEVGRGIGREITLQSFPSQHDETKFNFECDRYVGFRGGEYWQLGSAYAGGLRYAGYTPMSVRITEGQNNEVDGYIEFDEPVPANAKVYVDVDFSGISFLGNFSEVSGKGYFSLGSKKDNGKS